MYSILQRSSGKTEFSFGFECKGGSGGVTRSVFDIMRFIKNDTKEFNRMQQRSFLVDPVNSLEPTVLFPENTLQNGI